MEFLQGINWILTARPILACQFVPCLLVALTASIAIIVVALAVRGIALMWRRLEGVNVCFHDIELGAPLPIYIIGVAIVVAPAAWRRITLLVFSRGPYEIEGSVAATADLREVHVVLN